MKIKVISKETVGSNVGVQTEEEEQYEEEDKPDQIEFFDLINCEEIVLNAAIVLSFEF
jgi:hypothetical protein